jgi:hypothetical protein
MHTAACHRHVPLSPLPPIVTQGVGLGMVEGQRCLSPAASPAPAARRRTTARARTAPGSTARRGAGRWARPPVRWRPATGASLAPAAPPAAARPPRRRRCTPTRRPLACWPSSRCGGRVSMVDDPEVLRLWPKLSSKVHLNTSSSTFGVCRQHGRCRGSVCWRTWRRRGCRRHQSRCAQR